VGSSVELFYDIVETAPGRLVALVADVSGKGIPAAMVLGSLRSTFRALARQRLEPARILAELSAALLQEWEGIPYVTCIVAVVDLRARTMGYSNGGHPPGLLAGLSGVRRLDCGGPPVGLLANAVFEQQLLRLFAGDVCLLVSDGVTEALDGVPLERYFELWDIERASAADLCDAVMADALQGRGPGGDEGWEDDRTVVVVRVGSAEAAEAGGNSDERELTHASSPAHPQVVRSSS
jgi:sigma-B regulation protein RsbU (phosphoserine phosphatase)